MSFPLAKTIVKKPTKKVLPKKVLRTKEPDYDQGDVEEALDGAVRLQEEMRRLRRRVRWQRVAVETFCTAKVLAQIDESLQKHEDQLAAKRPEPEPELVEPTKEQMCDIDQHTELEAALAELVSNGSVTEVVKITDGAFLVKGFGAYLGLGEDFQEQLEKNYPVRHADDSIVWGAPQWVEGDHEALMYRGNKLKRGKMWFQVGDPNQTRKFSRYVYTGFSHAVLPATSDIANCAQLQPAFAKYNEVLQRYAPSFGQANHAIVTHYADGVANIGMHSDKTRSLGERGLITVVKTGGPAAARPFCITRSDSSATLFHDVVQPGDAILMTMAANAVTKHGVPPTDDPNLGPSGSVVFRTVVDELDWHEVEARIRTLRRNQGKRVEERKRKREEDPARE